VTLTLNDLLEFLKATILAGRGICPGLRYDFYSQRDRYSVLLRYRNRDSYEETLRRPGASVPHGLPLPERLSFVSVR
jgi:hypothetical protein